MLEGSQLHSGNDIRIEATTGNVAMLAPTDEYYERLETSSSNALWQEMADRGESSTSANAVELYANGNIQIIAGGQILVEYPQGATVQQSIAQIAQTPDTWESCTLAEVAAIVWISLLRLSTPIWAFMPGSRALSRFLAELGA